MYQYGLRRKICTVLALCTSTSPGIEFENHNIWAQHLEFYRGPKRCTCTSLGIFPDLGWHAPKCNPAFLNGLIFGMFHNQKKADIQL